jgi:capsular polysaccharide biosynthesis protein
MDLKQFLAIIKKRFLLVILITVITTVFGALANIFLVKPMYKADISVIIGSNAGKENTSASGSNDFLMYRNMVESYSVLARTRTVAEDVISVLNLNMTTEELIASISIDTKSDTEFMTITVRHYDPKLAADIANQTAKSLKRIGAYLRNSDNVYILDKALVPGGAYRPRIALNISIFFFFGLTVSMGIIFLLEQLDNTIKSEEALTLLIGWVVIGSIPDFDDL